MEPTPLISVLIPTHNREAYIHECLVSVLRQSFTDYEIIVSDNASTDRTVAIVESLQAKYTKIRIIRHLSNRGPLKNWAECLHAAKGKYVHWLWSDDTVENGFYTKCIKQCNLNIVETVIGCAANIIDSNGKNIGVRYLAETDYLSWRAIEAQLGGRFQLALSPAAYILPKRAVREHFYDSIPPIGNIEPVRRAIGPDYLMILGSIMNCGGIRFIKEPLVNFRVHDASISVTNSANLTAHYTYALIWFINKHKLLVTFTGRIRFVVRAVLSRNVRLLFRSIAL